MAITVLFGHFFEAKKHLDQVDCAIGPVGVAPSGKKIVKAELIARQRVYLMASYSTKSFLDEKCHVFLRNHL